LLTGKNDLGLKFRQFPIPDTNYQQTFFMSTLLLVPQRLCISDRQFYNWNGNG